MEPRTEIQIDGISPLVQGEYPQPHHTYIHAVNHYMMERTLGMDCLLYVNYIAGQNMFRVNFAKSVNISAALRNEVDLEMEAIMIRQLSQ